MIEQLYLNGRQYDCLLSGRHDLSFWLSQARHYGDPILELACGTGRVALPLAQAGFRVIGIDYAEAMLQEARKKATAAHIDIAWINADIRNFDVGQTFPLIIFPANAICHLLDRAALEACLACVRKHLAQPGRLIIAVFVPDLHILLRDPHAQYPFAEYDDPDGKGKVVVTSSNRYEADTQINRVTTFHKRPGEATDVVGTLAMRMYFPQELDALLHYNGFVMEQKYGNYDQTAFDANAKHQLVVCRPG